MYTILTLRLHYPPEYVLDKMEFYEIKAVMENQHLAYKDSWELARLVAYMIALTNSTKQLKLSDIMEFSWDESESVTNIKNEDIERLSSKAKQYENLFKEE